MRQDSRLSRLLHVLLHMDHHDGPLTSDFIAGMLGSNPAVVRRIMAGLRDAGYVASEKGHGGGWTLSRPLSDITLLNVYRALGHAEIFAFGLASQSPTCLVEQAVNTAMRKTLDEAEQLIMQRFGEITLSDVAADFSSRHAAHPLSADNNS